MPRKHVTIGQRTFAMDARPDRLDLRDRPFRPRLVALPSRYPSDAQIAEWLPRYQKARLVRDQGPDGACTGFGLAAVINYLLFLGTVDSTAAPRHVSAAMLYELARLYDEWPGEDYDGSSCRGALKGWHRHGVCRDELWPYVIKRGKRVFVTPTEDPDDRFDPHRNWDLDALDTILGVYYRVDSRSVVDMQSAILETGAIYVSGVAHEGWDLKRKKGLRGHAGHRPDRIPCRNQKTVAVTPSPWSATTTGASSSRTRGAPSGHPTGLPSCRTRTGSRTVRTPGCSRLVRRACRSRPSTPDGGGWCAHHASTVRMAMSSRRMRPIVRSG